MSDEYLVKVTLLRERNLPLDWRVLARPFGSSELFSVRLYLNKQADGFYIGKAKFLSEDARVSFGRGFEILEAKVVGSGEFCE